MIQYAIYRLFDAKHKLLSYALLHVYTRRMFDGSYTPFLLDAAYQIIFLPAQ
jgi:hypothetical protein